MNTIDRPRRLAAAAQRVLAGRRYRQSIEFGKAAGTYGYRFGLWPGPVPDPPLVELRLRADGPDGIDREAATAWYRRQTLAELRAGVRADGAEAWRIDQAGDIAPGTEASWFAAPSFLPEVVAAHLESAMLVAAAEAVDAVVVRERVTDRNFLLTILKVPRPSSLEPVPHAA